MQSSTSTGRATGWWSACSTNARERVLDPPEVKRLTPSDDYLTMCIAVAKAVQD